MKKSVAVFTGPNRAFELQSFEVVPPSPGAVALRLVSSGICGTDQHIHQGCIAMPGFPLVSGHEFIGEVDAIGENAACNAFGEVLRPGDRCIACVAIPCGKCPNCRRGETASCMAFGVTYVKPVADAPHFHGGFSEYLISPAANLVKLPDGVDPFAAAAFPCGGPTVIRACEYGGGLEPGEFVVIQGNGSLGLFALAWVKAHGCRVAVIGSASNLQRLALTRELAPDCFFDYRTAAADNLPELIRERAMEFGCGDGADVVIETSGAPEAFPLGLSLLRTRGRYFVPGQYSDRGAVAILPHLITFRALRVIGSGQYTLDDIASYLHFLKERPELQAIFRRMVTRYPLREVNTAFTDVAAGRAIKAVFAAEEE